MRKIKFDKEKGFLDSRGKKLGHLKKGLKIGDIIDYGDEEEEIVKHELDFYGFVTVGSVKRKKQKKKVK